MNKNSDKHYVSGHALSYSFGVPYDIISYIKETMKNRNVSGPVEQQMCDIMEQTRFFRLRNNPDDKIDGLSLNLDKQLLITESNFNGFLYVLNAGYGEPDTGSKDWHLIDIGGKLFPHDSCKLIVNSSQSLMCFLKELIRIVEQHYCVDLFRNVLRRKEPNKDSLLMNEVTYVRDGREGVLVHHSELSYKLKTYTNFEPLTPVEVYDIGLRNAMVGVTKAMMNQPGK